MARPSPPPSARPFGEAWMAEYFAEVDRMDPAGLVAWYADDATFRFADAPPVRGKPAIAGALAGFYGRIASMHHRMTGCWADGESGVWEAEVTFGTPDERTVRLPAVSVLRTRGGKVQDFRMVMDAAPLAPERPGTPAKEEQMTTEQTTATRERSRYLEPLTADNAAMLLIDYQTGTMLGVQDIRLDQFRSNVLGLAKTAKVHGLPVVLTASYAEGPNGPLMPELLDMFPDAPVVYRPGPINAWDDPAFVAAVEATGRKKLIMAGVTADVCLMFPALSALAAGYDVHAVYDASGCWDQMSELTSVMRLTQAGAVCCNWAVIAAGLQADWRRPTAEGTLAVMHEHLPFYGMLSNNQAGVRPARAKAAE